MLAAAVFVVALVGVGEARACSCARRASVLEQFERSDAVVVFRVESVRQAEPGQRAGYEGVVSAEAVVERVYKGRLKVGDHLTFAQGGGADCIWTFTEKSVGRSLLGYLQTPEGASPWLLGTCTRSGDVAYRRDDLLYLDHLPRTRGRTRLSGTLNFFAESEFGVAGRKVRVAGAKKSYEVVTDEQGVYEIYDLPAGTYTVEVETPPGWKPQPDYAGEFPPDSPAGRAAPRPKSFPVLLRAGRHAGLNVNFWIDNAVAGKILDPTGRPMEDVCLDLVPAGGEKGPYLADCTEKDGRFRIDEIPPGRYVLVVNDDGQITADEPFPAFYYPNATRREDATVFDVGAGDFVEDLQIHAPAAVETVTVEGLLLYADGRPVADESVTFVSEKKLKAAAEGKEPKDDARATTDARGRFSLKVLRGERGRLRGELMTYAGDFENCPQIERLVRESGKGVPTLTTPPAYVQADTDLYGLELKFPFRSCKKATPDH